jgi:hypothetical protein
VKIAEKNEAETENVYGTQWKPTSGYQLVMMEFVCLVAYYQKPLLIISSCKIVKPHALPRQHECPKMPLKRHHPDTRKQTFLKIQLESWTSVSILS